VRGRLRRSPSLWFCWPGVPIIRLLVWVGPNRWRGCGRRRLTADSWRSTRREHETECFRAGCSWSAGRGGRLHGPRIWTGRWKAAPIFGVKIPAGYRDWRLISVAHEEGNLNDLRAILGNDVAIKASREGQLPYPDGTIIARLAWDYVPSEENNKAFGRPQSFVAGPPKNGVQFMVKEE
jgi:hypothetical protein